MKTIEQESLELLQKIAHRTAATKGTIYLRFGSSINQQFVGFEVVTAATFTTLIGSDGKEYVGQTEMGLSSSQPVGAKHFAPDGVVFVKVEMSAGAIVAIKA